MKKNIIFKQNVHTQKGAKNWECVKNVNLAHCHISKDCPSLQATVISYRIILLEGQVRGSVVELTCSTV